MGLNRLFIIVICSFLVACGSVPPAPEARPSGPAPVALPASRAPSETPPAAGNRSEAVFQVLLALGVDYRPGGRSHESGFDCSGLVQHVYREAFGVRLPPDTAQQSRAGTPIDRSQLAPGDLVFFNTLGRPNSHVGLYIGDGRFVHAPRSGAQVRIERVDARYWAQRFNGARRIDVPS
jgi:cell wall-associated NlpC family hydrolase